MKFNLPALAAAVVVCVSSSAAFAATPVVATLQSGIEGTQKPIAGNSIFTCKTDTCTAGNPAGDAFSTSACRQLAHAVGKVTAYSAGARNLDEAKLAKCNASAKN